MGLRHCTFALPPCLPTSSCLWYQIDTTFFPPSFVWCLLLWHQLSSTWEVCRSWVSGNLSSPCLLLRFFDLCALRVVIGLVLGASILGWTTRNVTLIFFQHHNNLKCHRNWMPLYFSNIHIVDISSINVIYILICNYLTSFIIWLRIGQFKSGSRKVTVLSTMSRKALGTEISYFYSGRFNGMTTMGH